MFHLKLLELESELLAKEQVEKGFAELPAEARAQVLQPFDEAALKVVAPKDGEKRSIMDGPPLADPSYGKLKKLLLALYFYSETVQTGVFDYVHVPGRWDPSVPVTAETRPAGGTTAL